jgi:hypothetical protein
MLKLTAQHKANREFYFKRAIKDGIECHEDKVFSDECRFCIYNDGDITCWCRKGEGFLDKCSQESVKFGGGGIMFCYLGGR